MTSRQYHGESKTLLYGVWRGMRSRCNDPSHASFIDYGARGIQVCDEWDRPDGYPAFRDWARANDYQVGLELDRIDGAAGYGPSNCRWVLPRHNARNRRTNVWVTAFGDRKILADWALDPRCKVSYATLRRRICDFDWLPEEAITHRPANTGRYSNRTANNDTTTDLN